MIECVEAVLNVEWRSANPILGALDEVKLRSCATLLAHVMPPSSMFEQMLETYFDGRPDPQTRALLA